MMVQVKSLVVTHGHYLWNNNVNVTDVFNRAINKSIFDPTSTKVAACIDIYRGAAGRVEVKQ
jgi:hypothetical protein